MKYDTELPSHPFVKPLPLEANALQANNVLRLQMSCDDVRSVCCFGFLCF